MTYPIKYTRQYDFLAYQNANPTRPLPGDKINADYNAIVMSVDEIVEFLKLFVRADGVIANESIGRDQLSTEIQDLIDGLEAGGVASIFGRTGVVVAVAGDYTAAQVTNDSAVSGATVKAALETLNTALSGYAPLASPTFTGVPIAPTASVGTNTTQIATTAFVKAAVDVVLGGVGAAFDTLSEIATELALKAPLASPTFTGTVTLPAATVTLAMMADMATASLLGRNTAGTGVPEVLSAATARTLLGLVIGTNVQAYDATLLSIAALGTAADKLAYTTGVDTWAETAFTAAGRALIDDADASAQRTTLGLGTAAVKNTGTSGNTVPLLDGANTFSAAQVIAGTTAGFIGVTVQSTDPGANGPGIDLQHVSASPAANDTVGAFRMIGKNSAAADVIYGFLNATILDPTNGSEDSTFGIGTYVAGALATRLIVAGGIQVGSPTGGDKGIGTANVSVNSYVNGVSVIPLYKAVEADAAATNNNSVQDWFATNPGVTVEAGVLYEVEGLLMWGGTGAATTHTTAFSIAGTATLTKLGLMNASSGKTIDASDTATNSGFGTSSLAASLIAAATNTLEGGFIYIRGIIKINAAGTIRPQFTFGTAPGNTPVVRAGTFFRMQAITNPTGTWS